MALNQQTSNLITTTINAFNGEVANISPLDGISLIDSWTSALRDTDQAGDPVVSDLSELKAELQSGNPDNRQIQHILQDLIDQARAVAGSAEADVQTRLNELVKALDGFSHQLGGSAKMVDPQTQQQQAPMTSTVGGESTHSGAGASAFGTNNDDDLSNRNGGVTSIEKGESAMGMDDPTGSDGGSGGMDPNGGPSSGAGNNVSHNNSAMGMEDFTGSEGAERQDGGSYGSGYGTGSEGDDYSANSGTQRSGVSGGSADSGSGSSGGRSQY